MKKVVNYVITKCIINFYLKIRYWESLQYFDEAILCTPNEAKIYEMKAQVTFHIFSFSSDEHLLNSVLVYC